MSVTFQTTGFAELDRALAEIEKTATAKAIMRRSLKKAAQPMADIAEAKAPVLTGTLRESVTVSTKLSKRQKAMHRKMFKNDKAAVEMFVGPGALSAATQQEFGNEHNAPQPFMRPAWEQDKMAMLDRIGNEMWSEIDKTAARAAKKAARG
jgi:HK97 gp10 family phage protein